MRISREQAKRVASAIARMEPIFIWEAGPHDLVKQLNTGNQEAIETVKGWAIKWFVLLVDNANFGDELIDLVATTLNAMADAKEKFEAENAKHH